MNRFNWIERPAPDADVVRDLADAATIPAAGARLLAARSLVDAAAVERYLNPRADDTHDPFAFANMERAVELVAGARDAKARILVHGDYDVDGISGTAMLYHYLAGLVPEVMRFVPDRRKDGYGVAERAVEWAIKEKVALFIAVDCGTSDAVLIRRLEAEGINVIVCDHHTFPPDGDYAGVMLNPVREGETYPFPSLCGAGVAYKFIEALDRRGIRGNLKPESLVDLMAMATVGDLASLTGENRYYVRAGLELMNTEPRAAIDAMKGFARLGQKRLTAGHISFSLAPRINAPGRVSRPKPALEILCEDGRDQALRLASILESDNERRKELTRKVETEAIAQVEAMPDRDERGAFVLAGRGWDEGVLGIAASRVVDTYGRPAVLISLDGELPKGSGRSISGVNLKEALDAMSDCFVRYGGHAAAVGLTLDPDKLETFQRGLDERLREVVNPALGAPLRIDTTIEIEDCTMELVGFLSRCEPFGYGNSTPIWRIADVQILRDTCIVGDGHLKLYFSDTRGNPGEAIKFGWEGPSPDDLAGRAVDLAVTIRKGEYMGREYPELRLLDMRPAGSSDTIGTD